MAGADDGSLFCLPALLAGMIAGFVALYFRRDDRVVVLFPGPHNAGKVQYTDAAGACFEYEQTAVACPAKGAFSPPVQ